ncbi:uncharacterized protein LOC112462895 [Temnothorax curvispinosus]|uniref:Uncharacterized protein LOC112462895 n=1 Tax=Temnothorax curvispinosus TaxID=300111 RepID=A0A6J1QVQ8_9HYME|nr:uncharacterized protein LOC112462895 [Temnothorax curvispinosus]
MKKDHDNYYAKRSEDEDENCNNNILYNRTSREDDSLLVDVVKGYPHLYDKQSRDFKDIKKKNNSWEEIGEILNATAADCQTKWARLRERYSREKKLQEMETRSGSGHVTRSQSALYEQMSFLFKHVKSRKSITNISHSTTKQSSPIRKSVLTEKSGSSNRCVSRNIGSTHNKYDTINKSPENMLKTGFTPAMEVSRSSLIHSCCSDFLPHSHNIDIPASQKNICNQRKTCTINPISAEETSTVKHLELYYENTVHESILAHLTFSSSETSLDSNNEFSALRSPDELYNDKETVSLVEFSQTLKQKKVLPVTNLKIVSPNREIVSPTQCKNRNTLSSSLLVDSPSKIANSAALSVHSSLSNIPTKLAKKVKRKSTADDKIDDSFVKLTSAVTTHFEKKNQNTIPSEVLQLDEENIFGKTVACQLKKIAEPEKTKIKGQIMKMLYNL